MIWLMDFWIESFLRGEIDGVEASRVKYTFAGISYVSMLSMRESPT